MLYLTDLEPEVVALILEFVDDTSPQSTKAVACVNRYLNQLTRFISHRHKVVNIRGSFDGDVLELVRAWTHDEIILANIRTLTVKGRINSSNSEDEDLSEGENEDEDEENDTDQEDSETENNQVDQLRDDGAIWEPLVTLISKIGRLRQFDWNIAHAVPISVFDALENHQRFSTLRIFNFSRASPRLETPHPVELRLAKSSALTHIRLADQVDASDRHPDKLHLGQVAFRAIVASAPNLEYAGLIKPRWEPMATHSPADMERWEAAFYSHQRPNPSVRQLTLDGFEMTRQTLEDWATTIDLRCLENVKFSRGVPTADYFQYAATALPKLEHLSLNLRNIGWRADGIKKAEIIAAVQDYINSCSPLHTLSLWSWIEVLSLSEILHRHGASLRNLQLHERETINLQERALLSLDNVKSIRASCPNLRSFTFDLLRHDQKLQLDEDDNLPYYEELARFQHLDTVQIYFDVGLPWISGVPSWGPMPPGLDVFALNNTFGDGSTANTNDTSATNEITAAADTSTPSPPSPTRPAKRKRTETLIPPSDDADLTPYVQHIWRTIFGDKAGARRLDVKIGDWESTTSVTERNMQRHFVVRPHERDDIHEPTVVTHRKRR